MVSKLNKRGGDMLTPAQLVTLILAVLGMVIAFFILFALNLKGDADDKACSLSVLSRAGIGSASIVPTGAQSLVPLKCTTKKICITNVNGGSCAEFAGDKDVKTFIINPVEIQKSANEIEKINAEALYNCWKLMGEGKADIFPGTEPGSFSSIIWERIADIKPTCFICSRISMSESLKANKNYQTILDKVNVEGYLETRIPEGGKLTYLQLLTDEKLNAYPSNFIKTKSVPSDSALIFSQIVTAESPGDAFFGGANSVAWTGVGVAALSKKVVGIWYQVGAAIVYGAFAAATQYQNQGLSAAICGPLSSNKEQARQGCSIIGRYDYKDINTINSQCFRIEGNP